ncbi:MAG: methionine--tRNA ligase [archaeon]|nr:methionine--tRNA ligase [archaeon]
MSEIEYSDWQKLDIRIGTVIEAKKAQNADKLIVLQIDFGEEKKQVVTAMAEFFDANYFVGKQIPVIVNLKPRTMRGLESAGMIVSAEADGKPVLLHPENKIANGSKVE